MSYASQEQEVVDLQTLKERVMRLPDGNIDAELHALIRARLPADPVPGEKLRDPDDEVITIIRFIQNMKPDEGFFTGGESAEASADAGVGVGAGAGAGAGAGLDSEEENDVPMSQGAELDAYTNDHSPEQLVSEFLAQFNLQKLARKAYGKFEDEDAATDYYWQELRGGDWNSAALRTFATAVCSNRKKGQATSFPSGNAIRKKTLNNKTSTARRAASDLTKKVKAPRIRVSNSRARETEKDALAVVTPAAIRTAVGLQEKQAAAVAQDAAGAAPPPTRPRTLADAKAFLLEQASTKDLWIEVAFKCAQFAKYENLKRLFGNDLEDEVAVALVESKCWELLAVNSGDSRFAENFKISGEDAGLPSGLLTGKLERAQPGACAVCNAGSQHDALTKAEGKITELEGQILELKSGLAAAELKLHQHLNPSA